MGMVSSHRAVWQRPQAWALCPGSGRRCWEKHLWRSAPPFWGKLGKSRALKGKSLPPGGWWQWGQCLLPPCTLWCPQRAANLTVPKVNSTWRWLSAVRRSLDFNSSSCWSLTLATASLPYRWYFNLNIWCVVMCLILCQQCFYKHFFSPAGWVGFLVVTFAECCVFSEKKNIYILFNCTCC